MLFSAARVLRSFSPFNSSITRSDLNLALKLLLCLDIVMNPLFRIDFSISDSLKIVRKSVLIYETIIGAGFGTGMDSPKVSSSSKTLTMVCTQ